MVEVENPAPIPTDDPATKPGWQTTEFWLTLVALIVQAVIGSGIVADGSVWAQVLAVIAGALTAAGYTIVRGGLKVQLSRANSEYRQLLVQRAQQNYEFQVEHDLQVQRLELDKQIAAGTAGHAKG